MRWISKPFQQKDVDRRVSQTQAAAIQMATRFSRRFPFVDADDLRQDLLARLVRLAQTYRCEPNGPPFINFILPVLRCAAYEHVRLHWPNYHESLSEVIGEADGEDVTFMDVFDAEQHRREECTSPGEMRFASRVSELRETILSLETLRPLERLTLLLRLDGESNLAIREATGFSLVTVTNSATDGIEKLKEHYGVTA